MKQIYKVYRDQIFSNPTRFAIMELLNNIMYIVEGVKDL